MRISVWQPCRDPTRVVLAPFHALETLELRGCDLSTSAWQGASAVQVALVVLCGPLTGRPWALTPHLHRAVVLRGDLCRSGRSMLAPQELPACWDLCCRSVC